MINDRQAGELSAAPVGDNRGHTEQLGNMNERQSVDWLLTRIQPVLQKRSGGWTDPYESLKRICPGPGRVHGRRLAEELRQVRHGFAHWGNIDFAMVRWAFETAQLLLAYIGETAAASGVLRQQRRLPQHQTASDNLGNTAGQPRSAAGIRAALRKILAGALAELIAGWADGGSGIDWQGFTGDPNQLSCNELLGALANIRVMPDNKNAAVPDLQRWIPFPSQMAAGTVKACSRELLLAGTVSFSGIERELSTAHQMLAVLNHPKANTVTALLEELWRERVTAVTSAEAVSGREEEARKKFVTADRERAWDVITKAAIKRRAGIFEIVVEPGQEKSAFMTELDTFLREHGFIIFSIGPDENAGTFVGALVRQLSECPDLSPDYAKHLAEQLQSRVREAGQDPLMGAVYEIDALASRHRVAFLFNGPRAELVHELQSRLQYLPTALIVYAHRLDPRLALDPRVGAIPLIFHAGESEADPVLRESLDGIRLHRPDFPIDATNPVKTIRQFVDAEAKSIVADANLLNLPSVFDCLFVLGEVREPALLAAAVGRVRDAGGFNDDVAARVIDHLRQFRFIVVDGNNGGVVLHSHIRELARNIVRDRPPGRIQRIHSAAADFFAPRIKLTPKTDNQLPWSRWDPVYDPSLALDIHDWLVHIGASGPVCAALQLRLVRLFLDAFWWYECDVPTQFSKSLLAWYREDVDSNFAWLDPLDRLRESYVSRFAEESDEDVQAWQRVLQALADLSEHLPDTENQSDDRAWAEVIITMLKADATWGISTSDEMLDGAAQLYGNASGAALELGDFDGKWMALWADLFRAQVLSTTKPETAADLAGDIEARANAQPENEIRVELALLHGQLAWDRASRAWDGGDLARGRDEMARALDYYGLAAQRAYIYHVFQEKEMAPSPYTQSLYNIVVEQAWRTYDDVRERDPDTAEAALDRYLWLFDSFWSQAYPDGEVAVGQRNWVFPPAPAGDDLFSLDTPYADQVRKYADQVQKMESPMGDTLNRRLDEHIDWPAPITLRAATIQDVDQIVQLHVKTGLSDPSDTDGAKAKAAVAAALRDGHDTCCVAETNVSVVGFALTSLGHDGSSVRLESLIILPEYRSRGVTYRLVQAVRKQMQAAGRTQLSTDVFSDDEMATEMGFELASIYRCSV